MENDLFLYRNIFFINPTIKSIIITFPFDIYFITFSFNYFFYTKFFLICFLQLFFVTRCNRFFTIKITHDICPQNSFFNFCNHKNFFRSIWNVTFCKNAFIFWNSYITNYKFRILFIIIFIKINICAWKSTGFILIVLWYALLHLLTISSNLPIYTFLDTEVRHL